MAKVLYVDLNRCIYCRSCEVACEREHGGRSNMFVVLLEQRFPVPMSCRHCEKSPCRAVCPAEAISRVQGAVLIDTMKCIGCKLCAMVCPFGVIQLDHLTRTVKKCDLCAHRTALGSPPACVATCPGRALAYEEFDDIMRRVKEKSALTLLSGVGSGPGVVVTAPVK